MRFERFSGTVRNTTSQTVRDVRVEILLSNGVELGPTPRVDAWEGSHGNAGRMARNAVRRGPVSAPTYDADDDGVNDTYVRSDNILIDIEFSEAVKVDGSVQLRLDLGTDDSTPTNSRKSVDLNATSGVLHGGMTLRFSYEVLQADVDTDGLWVQTDSSNKVLFTPDDANNESTIVSAASGFAAVLTKSGLPTAGGQLGGSRAKVNGGKTSDDTGPLPSSATVSGKTLTVTFDRALDTSVDTGALAFHFSVQGAGDLGNGNRNAYQHPSAISFTGSNNEELEIELGQPARAGDTVRLTYALYGDTGLKGAGGRAAPAFVDLAVTNNTSGTAGPLPERASVSGRFLRLVFDGTLDEDSTPQGTAFVVHASDPDDDSRSIGGTGTATVSGTEVTVELAEAVHPDEQVSVSYEKPGSAPLQSTASAAVLSFDRFRIETVYDDIPPEYASAEALQTGNNPVKSKVVVYFDEPLDPDSVPAGTDFALIVGGNAATPSSATIEGNAVTPTLGQAMAGGTQVTVGHTPGTNPIRDLAGNAAEGLAFVITAAAAGKPTLQTSGGDKPAVAGSRVALTFDKPLNPEAVPAPGAFTLHYPRHAGQEDASVEYTGVDAVSVEGAELVLRLPNPVYPCAPAVPFTATYVKPTDTDAAKLQGLDTDEVAAFGPQDVTNARASWCVDGRVVVPEDPGGAGGFSGVSGQGKSVRLNFQRPLDTTRALPASMFSLAGASGASAPAVEGASYVADATGVALTLGRALTPGEAVTVSYERPAREPGLWDTEGRQIADFSVEVANEAPAAPAVTGVEVVSDAGEDDTYGLGEAIRIRLTFDEAVEVEGAPRLKIDMDPAHWGEKWAAYESGGDTKSLTFAHTVVEPNLSTQGIAVLANTLKLNGGTIRSAPGAGAVLAFAVTLSRAATSAFTVDYATSDGSALAGEDYTAASGTLSFQAGDSSGTVEVAVLDDAHDEGEETLTLTLSNASGAVVTDGEATGTIENADLMPGALGALRAGDGRAGGRAHRGADGGAAAAGLPGAVRGPGAAAGQRAGLRARLAVVVRADGHEAGGCGPDARQRDGCGPDGDGLARGRAGRHRRGHGRHGRHGGPQRPERRGRHRHDGLEGHGGPACADGRCIGDDRLRPGGRRARRRPVRLDGARRWPVLELRVRAEPREPRRHPVGVEPQLPVALQRHRGRAVARRRRADDDDRGRLHARRTHARPVGGQNTRAGRLQRPERRADERVDDRVLPVGGLPGQRPGVGVGSDRLRHRRAEPDAGRRGAAGDGRVDGGVGGGDAGRAGGLARHRGVRAVVQGRRAVGRGGERAARRPGRPPERLRGGGDAGCAPRWRARGASASAAGCR